MKILRIGILGLVVAGCTAEVTTAPTVAPQAGSVTLRWSVDGSFDPAACDAFNVDTARVDIYDAGGQPILTRFVDCRAFRATITLDPSRYSARLQMVDSGRNPLSTSIPISSFTIIGNSDLVIDTDFPRSSFF